MEPARVFIDLDDYDIDDMSENQKGRDSGDYRLERRWKRRELYTSNKSMKHDHSESGTKSTVKGRGNVAILTVEKGHGNMAISMAEKGRGKMAISTVDKCRGNVAVSTAAEKVKRNVAISTVQKDRGNVAISIVQKDRENVAISMPQKVKGKVAMSTAQKGKGKVAISTAGKGCGNVAILTAEKDRGNMAFSTAQKGRENVAILTAKKGLVNVAISKEDKDQGNVAISIAEKGLENVANSTTGKGRGNVANSKTGKGSGNVANSTTVKGRGDVAISAAEKPCGNVAISAAEKAHVLEDEIDEDYRLFLATYDPDSDIVSDGNVGDSDYDINIGCNKSDHNDRPCKEEEERLHNDLKLDKGSKQRDETGNKGRDSVKKQTSGPLKCRQNLGVKRGLSKKRPREDVSGVPENNCHGNMGLDVVDEDYQIFLNSLKDDYIPNEVIGNRSSVRQNSHISYYGWSEVDEDYLEYLNSVMIVDGEVEYMPARNTSKTCNVDGDSNSSDPDLILPEPSQIHENPEKNTSNTESVDGDNDSSDPDLILLDPNQIHENTPFVSSKAYDLSWFEAEKNSKEKWQLSACENYQFRRRLMDDLRRPYDQEEYHRLLHEVREKKQKERHVETRQGVVKSYRTRGVNKSYLELYPEVANAIAKFKQPERVLFLLRGFIFWLQNLTHEGIFRPWLDKKCLDIFKKM